MLLIHWRDVVEPVEIRDRLQVRLLLDQLFGAAMQETDVRIDASHNFTVEFQHQAKNAVGRWMLRSKIDGKISEMLLVHGQAFGSAFSSPGSG